MNTITQTKHAGGRPRKYQHSIRATYYGELEVAANIARLGGGSFSRGIDLLYTMHQGGGASARSAEKPPRRNGRRGG